MSNRCGLCHTGFLPWDVICDSPIYRDRRGAFHSECLRKVDAIIEEAGTNDVAHLVYPESETLWVFFERVATTMSAALEHVVNMGYFEDDPNFEQSVLRSAEITKSSCRTYPDNGVSGNERW
jgi:hypothetical protein